MHLPFAMQWPFFSPGPRLEWLQIEISTACTAACTYCPRTLFHQHWRSRHMELSVFKRLLPVLRRTRLAYLQGWGDPLTHPDFFTLVALARGAGCQVGTTTNGVLLDERLCQRLINEGPDLIGFSLAGLGTDNDRVRRGTRYATVLETIATLGRLKKHLGSERPHIHLAYLLRASDMDALEHLVPAFAGRGMSQVVISLVQSLGDPALASESLVPKTLEQRDQLRDRLEQLTEQGRGSGLDIHWRLPALMEECLDRQGGDEQRADLPLCTENIQQAAFVGVEGEVSPCVFCNLPLEEAGFAAARASGHRLHRLVFGTLINTDFAKIWNSAAYTAFRRVHRRGDFPAMCRDCSNLVVTDHGA